MSNPIPKDLEAVLDHARAEAYKMMSDDRQRAVFIAHRVLSQLGYTPPDIKLAMAIAAYLAAEKDLT
jgi:hypothetical protein